MRGKFEAKSLAAKLSSNSLIVAITNTALRAKIALDEFIKFVKPADTVAFSDGGDLIKTDYTDMAYFDADYVGTIDNF